MPMPFPGAMPGGVPPFPGGGGQMPFPGAMPQQQGPMMAQAGAPPEVDSFDRILSSLSKIRQRGVFGAVGHYRNYPQMLEQHRVRAAREAEMHGLTMGKLGSEILENREQTLTSAGERRRARDEFEYTKGQRPVKERRARTKHLSEIMAATALREDTMARAAAARGKELRDADQYMFDRGGRVEKRRIENLGDLAGVSKTRAEAGLAGARASNLNARTVGEQAENYIRNLIQQVGQQIQAMKSRGAGPADTAGLETQLRALLEFHERMAVAAGRTYPQRPSPFQDVLGIAAE